MRLNFLWTSRIYQSVKRIINWGSAMSLSVAPVSDISECLKAPLKDLPPSKSEWISLVGESPKLIIYSASPLDSLRLESTKLMHSVWTPDGVSGIEMVVRDSTEIQWKRISQIDYDAGSRVVQGSVIGGVAGAGAAIAILLLHCNDGDQCGLGAVAAFVCVPIGGLVGALIGLSRDKWKPLYCSEETLMDEGR